MGIKIFFLAIFALFMCFFGLIYPIVPFWGDDWQMMSVYGQLKPIAHSWIPARLLPPIIQTAMGIFSAYIIMPLSGLDFVDAITLTSALVLSFSCTLLVYICYKLFMSLSANVAYAVFITLIFIICGFCASKSTVMPLFLPADLQAEGMGYIFTLISFYIIPNMLNIALLCGFFYYQCIRLGILKSPRISPSLYLAAGGGG